MKRYPDKEGNIYFASKEILNAYNNLVKRTYENGLSKYVKTIDWIFLEPTYKLQVKRYIEQYREGYNSIDLYLTDLFYYEMNEEKLDLERSDINKIISKCVDIISAEEFQMYIIDECSEYFNEEESCED